MAETIRTAIELATALNSTFEKHTEASGPEVLKLLRALPKPILVDFNNVLVSQDFMAEAVNPEAKQLLDDLRKIGNIVIATAHWEYDLIKERMQEFGLWQDDIVIMHRDVWNFTLDHEDARTLSLVDEHIRLMANNGNTFNRDDYLGAFKPLAPLFCKPFLVPIIDDSPSVTEENPGLLGICVEGWDREADSVLDLVFPREEGLPTYTFQQAVETIANHYKSLEVE